MDITNFRKELWKEGLALCADIALSQNRMELLKRIKKFQEKKIVTEADREELLYIVKACRQILKKEA